MKTHWTGAALLSCAFVVGCGDRQPENSQNLELDTAPAAVDLRPGRSRAGGGTGARARPRRPLEGTAQPFPTLRVDFRRLLTIIASRRAATEASAPRTAAPRFREITVPAGTALPLELLTAISSETAQVETPVRARLRQAVVIDDYTALPAGTVLHGNVTDVDRAGRVQGRSRLAFRFTEAELDGGREELSTNAVSFEGEATKGEDATKVGAGAGVGAIIGGILGGGDGAAKGAAIGGAAGRRRRAGDARPRGLAGGRRRHLGHTRVGFLRARARALAQTPKAPIPNSQRAWELGIGIWKSGLALVPQLKHCRFRRLEAHLRMRAVAERLLRRRAAPAQGNRAALDGVFVAVPIDDAHVVAVDHIRTILPQPDRRHVTLRTRPDSARSR